MLVPEFHCALYDEIVPDGYDLLNAPPGKLDDFGVPHKPDAISEPGLFEFWTRLVSPPFFAKRPTFRRINSPSVAGPIESMLNWSGALVSTPWPKQIVFAAGGWNVPQVSPPSVAALGTPSNDPRSLLWVGLDGRNGALPNISLPQIGTGHWPNNQPQHFAWWEWWRNTPPKEPANMKEPDMKEPDKAGDPGKEITVIDNFAIQVGDEILAGLAVQVSGDVLNFIKNQRTGQFRSFLAIQPTGKIEPLGSSVEWVMERPTDPVTGKLYQLPAYSPVDFKYCLARAADGAVGPGREMTLADNALMIQMRELFADPYRTVTVSTPELRKDPGGSVGVTCTYQSP